MSMREFKVHSPQHSVEEVKRVVGKLNKGKATGPDSILAEYLIAGGNAVVLWLKEVLKLCYDGEDSRSVKMWHSDSDL